MYAFWPLQCVYHFSEVHDQHFQRHGRKNHGSVHGWSHCLRENFWWLSPKFEESSEEVHWEGFHSKLGEVSLVGIEPLKARYDVTKLDLTIHLLSL